jgi:hypothetical protein
MFYCECAIIIFSMTAIRQYVSKFIIIIVLIGLEYSTSIQ